MTDPRRNSNQLTPNEIKRYTINFWKVIMIGVAFAAILLLSIGLGLFGKLPTFRDLENPKSNLASEVISEDSQVLGTYYIHNRSNVRYNEISPNVINALVSTEDKRFYNHSGIDFKRSFTILFYNLIGKKQGASTITQQLALNLFSKEGRSPNYLKRVVQKLQELFIAVKLEREYTKEEIITMYLNTVDFGSYNTFGIKSAARTYFNTTPDKLKPDQAALLIGMLKGPSFYNPIRNPERAIARRNMLLENMYHEGFLSEEEFDMFKSKKLNLAFNPTDHNEGSAAYFRAVLKRDIQKIFEERSIQKADGTPYDLDRDGLKIYTTINSRMQEHAEEAQKEYLKDLQNQFNTQWKGLNAFNNKVTKQVLEQGIKRSQRYQQLVAEGKSPEEINENFGTPAEMTIFSWRGDIDTLMKPLDSVKYYKMMLRNALMSMEASGPQAGYVRAWVGGNDFEYFKYDQVKMGTRQVGSTAKPFTYAVAIDNGYSPCFTIPNEPISIDGWNPGGGDSPLPGFITLKTALANSQNWATARVMEKVGPTAVSTLTKRMGITSEVPAYPSICLGTYDASLYDMVGAYGAFVNHGLWTQPQYLLRIEDRNGAVIYEGRQNVVVALNPQTAYTMTHMLKGTVQNGTASRIVWKYGLRNPIGGKTGTTQNNSDGWFIGITPQLVTGVWTGCEDRSIHFRTTRLGGGTNSALPVFALYMKKVYADPKLNYSKGDFEPPKGGSKVTFDCEVYNQEQAPQETPQEEELGF